MNPQSGILAEGDNSAFFATYKVNYSLLEEENALSSFVNTIKSFPAVLEEISKINDIRITGTISFGKKLWDFLTQNKAELQSAASTLFDFPGYDDAPATQEDLYLHIHSKNNGASFDCGFAFVSKFAPEVLTVVDHTMGFVWRDFRDLTGFIDGTENPTGPSNRSEAALTQDGNSFVIVQRYVHNLDKWATLNKSEQESVIGRTKDDSVQLEPLPMGSHVAHTDIDHNDKNVKIVRHSLPYGMPNGVKGLWFTAYCHYLEGIHEMEKSIFGLRGTGRDNLMSYITPVTGGYYFTPSLDLLARL